MQINQLTPEKKTLVILHNLGTPKSTELVDVRAYLGEFLMDPEVITAPYFVRWGIVNLSVKPFRAKKTAKAYKEIWTKQGSPLLSYTIKQTELLREKLGKGNTIVDFSMRYGDLNSEETLKRYLDKGIEQILFFPLYPQYSSATTKSSVLDFKYALKKLNLNIPYMIIENFFQDSLFISAVSKNIEKSISEIQADHLLLSFHGVPEDMVQAQDPTKSHCLKTANCCENFQPSNSLCYRAHCLASARAIEKKLDIKNISISTSFQSKVGPKKWLGPYTEDHIAQLAKSGVKRLCIASPAFVADCLETLEELAIRGKEIFLEHGGEDFILAPAVNDSNLFIEFLDKKVKTSFEGSIDQ